MFIDLVGSLHITEILGNNTIQYHKTERIPFDQI